MKIIQNPISDEHKSAMFFDGVVATGERDGKKYTLKTFQDGEVGYDNKVYIGSEIRFLGETRLINDTDIELEDSIDIYVDKFFVITEEGVVLDKEEDFDVYNEFNEAVEAFKNFLGE